ncbi:MAG: hypothetical protein ACKVXR_02665, partial [Planctomycetota bacterium]
MSRECIGFRAALEAELLGRPSQERLSGLAWHEHLLSCGACRELLEREEALETLLASLPEPRLPSALAQRVLARLREDRSAELRLERLLDLDADLRAPRGLAAGVLAGLARERFAGAGDRAEARLDEILELDRELRVPPGLAGRVLAGLARERKKASEPARTASLRRRAWFYAVAAGLLLAFLGRLYWIRARPESRATVEPIVHVDPAPDPQMLA